MISILENSNKIKNDLKEINLEVCKKIWDIISVDDSKPSKSSPRIVIPNVSMESNGKQIQRISEQEARFIFCTELEKRDYFYSVETPTKCKYNFSGGILERSALSDLSIYQYYSDKLVQCVNVEFKAGNPEKKSIGKDIQKLVKEPSENPELKGNWFHIFKNVDKNTLPVLFEKFVSSFSYYEENKIEVDSISILFSFCVKDRKWACMKQFDWEKSKADLMKYTKEFFKIEYEIDNKKITQKNINGWKIIES